MNAHTNEAKSASQSFPQRNTNCLPLLLATVTHWDVNLCLITGCFCHCWFHFTNFICRVLLQTSSTMGKQHMSNTHYAKSSYSFRIFPARSLTSMFLISNLNALQTSFLIDCVDLYTRGRAPARTHIRPECFSLPSPN